MCARHPPPSVLPRVLPRPEPARHLPRAGRKPGRYEPTGFTVAQREFSGKGAPEMLQRLGIENAHWEARRQEEEGRGLGVRGVARERARGGTMV